MTNAVFAILIALFVINCAVAQDLSISAFRDFVLRNPGAIEVKRNAMSYFDVHPQYKRNLTAEEADKYVSKWSGPFRYLDLKTGFSFNETSQAENTYIDRASNTTYYVNEIHPLVLEAMAQSKTTSNNRKRQTPTVTMEACTDINLGGSCTNFTTSSFSWPTLPAPYKASISSFIIYDINYIYTVCTQEYYSGTCWNFRSLIVVNDLRYYGILNDEIRSIYMTAGPTTGVGVLYEDNYWSGKSVYVPTGSYPVMTGIPTSGANQFDNDAMSSYFNFPYTTLYIYQSVSFGVPVSAFSTSVGVMPTGWNDVVSSVITVSTF